MPKITMFDQTGKEIKDVNLADEVFGIEPNKSVLFDAIIMQRASLRQGTHKVKNRSEVRGGVTLVIVRLDELLCCYCFVCVCVCVCVCVLT